MVVITNLGYGQHEGRYVYFIVLKNIFLNKTRITDN